MQIHYCSACTKRIQSGDEKFADEVPFCAKCLAGKPSSTARAVVTAAAAKAPEAVSAKAVRPSRHRFMAKSPAPQALSPKPSPQSPPQPKLKPQPRPNRVAAPVEGKEAIPGTSMSRAMGLAAGCAAFFILLALIYVALARGPKASPSMPEVEATENPVLDPSAADRSAGSTPVGADSPPAVPAARVATDPTRDVRKFDDLHIVGAEDPLKRTLDGLPLKALPGRWR